MSGTVRKVTWRIFYRETLIIYGALLMGLLIFFGVTVFIYFARTMTPAPGIDRIMMFALLPLGMASIGVSFVLPQMTLKQVQPDWPIGKKLLNFRTSMIIKLALYEGPALFALVAFMVSQQWYFVYMFVLFIVLFLLNIPTLDRIAAALKLSYEEQMQLQSNESFTIDVLKITGDE